MENDFEYLRIEKVRNFLVGKTHQKTHQHNSDHNCGNDDVSVIFLFNVANQGENNPNQWR